MCSLHGCAKRTRMHSTTKQVGCHSCAPPGRVSRMAAIDTSRAHALGDAALALERKGHAARAAEKYGQAVEAAEALAQPDCLVVAALQLACVNALTSVASAHEVSPFDRAAAAAQLFARNDAALVTLQRRLAAGTLLGGRCRPYEVAWYDQRCSLVANDGGRPPSAAGKAEWARLVGFDALSQAAHNVLQEVLFSQHSPDARERQRCALVVAALDAATARLSDDAAAASLAAGNPNFLWTCAQNGLVMSFREAVARGVLERETASGAALAAAWARLEETGVLVTMGSAMDASAASVSSTVASREAARVAAAAAPECHECALSGCSAREMHAAHFKSCAACRGVAYCSKEHQVAHWPAHKKACKAARKVQSGAA